MDTEKTCCSNLNIKISFLQAQWCTLVPRAPYHGNPRAFQSFVSETLVAELPHGSSQLTRSQSSLDAWLPATDTLMLELHRSHAHSCHRGLCQSHPCSQVSVTAVQVLSMDDRELKFLSWPRPQFQSPHLSISSPRSSCVGCSSHLRGSYYGHPRCSCQLCSSGSCQGSFLSLFRAPEVPFMAARDVISWPTCYRSRAPRHDSSKPRASFLGSACRSQQGRRGLCHECLKGSCFYPRMNPEGSISTKSKINLGIIRFVCVSFQCNVQEKF